MKTNIISVKYEDKYMPKTFSGKAYSYYTNINVNVGDIVIAPTLYGVSNALVTNVNVPEEKISLFKDKLKTIAIKIDKTAFLQDDLENAV